MSYPLHMGGGYHLDGFVTRRLSVTVLCVVVSHTLTVFRHGRWTHTPADQSETVAA